MDRVKRFLPICGVFALLAVACGGGSSSTPAGDSEPGPAAVASPAPERQPDVAPTTMPPREPSVQAYAVPRGSRPHDVAPAADGGVWYTAQGAGKLGWLDPRNGEVKEIPLGQGSAPHGVIVGPDGAAWVTDGGQNAMVRVDARTFEVKVHKLPGTKLVNLNTAVFDKKGQVWFTGQGGVYGRLNPQTGE